MAAENLQSNEKFIFKCNLHASNISEKLLTFYEENELFDTVLVAGSGHLVVEVEAHRIVLSASSEYFLQLFRTTNVHKTEFKDTESSTFKSIIDFMYSGYIELSAETVESILRTAEFLKMKTLIEGCCDFIENHITFSNCLKWLQIAKEFNLLELKEKSLNFVYTNFEEVSKQKEMLVLDEMNLKDLLFNDNPYGDFEEHVFLAVVNWIAFDKLKREPLTLQLLSMVRYQSLTPKFIVKNRKSVCRTVESHKLICSWIQWHLLPETRSLDEQKFILKTRQPDGKLAVMSCPDNQNVNIQTFDTNMETWSIAKQIQLPVKKTDFSMIVKMEKLILVGGRTANERATNTIECLDLHTFQWTSLPSMMISRYWSELANLNENLFVFGGHQSYSNFVNSLEMYNFTTQIWQNLQPLHETSSCSKIVAHNGILYIADFVKGFLQSFNPSFNKWSSKPLNKEKLQNFGFAAVDGFLYIIGGFNWQRLNTVKRYNIANDWWSEVAPLPTNCSEMKSVIFGNKIVICGGFPERNLVREYILKNNTWNTMNSELIEFSKYTSHICLLPLDLYCNICS